MPITDATIYAEKLTKPSALLSSTSSQPSSASKCNASQVELQLLLNSTGSNKTSTESKMLNKHQGQKWQQLLDFEKILKQIRVAEKQHLRDKHDNSATNGSGKSATSIHNNSAVSKNLKYSRHLKQVQRLNGNDMHYFGNVPKETTMSVVVCNVCAGIYTKVGFNNHMMLQHPSVWSSVSTKLATIPSTEGYSVHANDNSQDSVRESSAAEVVGSPSDISGTMSTCSNASSTSSMSSSTYATNQRHKSGTKHSSTSGSTSSGNNRSRSKSKHQSHSSSASSGSGETLQTSSKSSKKTSGSNTVKLSTAISTTPINVGAPHVKDASVAGILTENLQQPISVYSSSSNSSCSLPPTPKLITAINAPDIASAGVINAASTTTPPHQRTYSPANVIAFSESKDKLSVDQKKKVKSSSFIGQESVDSSTSNSSTECGGDRSNVNGTCTATGAAGAQATKTIFVTGNKLNNTITEQQMSELDQAVSSITGGQNIKNELLNDIVIDANTNGTYKIQSTLNDAKVNNIPHTVNGGTSLMNTSYGPQETMQGCDEPMPHNSSDDNSILTLEDMLDSKFINEILNTAESEIHFDENELDPASQQTYMQQPAAKRMRFDGAEMQQHPAASEIAGEFTVFQQQQQQQQLLQQQQLQQQFTQFDTSNLDNIKMYNSSEPQTAAMDPSQYQAQLQQQQPQITAIDAMQLQQLLYQQQNLNTYDATGLVGATNLPQQQYDPSGLVNHKQLINICAEGDLEKQKNIAINPVNGKLTDYASMATIDNDYEENTPSNDAVSAHFQIFNVPSLTDDMVGTSDDLMMPSNQMIDHTRTAPQQYVLPSSEEHLIYEITANNQVAVMSQQRQQQVITEFLNQAGYENMENMNSSIAVNHSNNTTSTTKTLWDDITDLMDINISHIDTVKSCSSMTSNGSTSESKTVKNEPSNANSSKYQDDFYYNVFLYAGIPRPLSINCFGLIKLPIGTTFRKHLLQTRKSNNSSLILSGSINGVVGSNSVAAAARFANMNVKPMQSYFTSLSAGNNTITNNEFAIISNSHSPNIASQHQTYTQQNKQNAGGSIEITFTANGTTTSSVMQRVRAKSNSNTSALNSINSAGGIVKNKFLLNVGAAGTASIMTNGRSSMLPHNAKTIYVTNTMTNSCNGDRMKFIKRGLLAKLDIPKKATITPKQIADILRGNKNTIKQQQQQQTNDSNNMLQTREMVADDHFKQARVNHFYERRRKLLNLSQNTHQQQKHKALKQQLIRTLSDCSINSIVHCKANTTGGNNSSDIVRVFA